MEPRFQSVKEPPQDPVSLWKVQLWVTVGMCVFTLATGILNLLGKFLLWELVAWLTIFYGIPAVAASVGITVLAVILAFRQKRWKEPAVCLLLATVTVLAAVLYYTKLTTWFW